MEPMGRVAGGVTSKIAFGGSFGALPTSFSLLVFDCGVPGLTLQQWAN